MRLASWFGRLEDDGRYWLLVLGYVSCSLEWTCKNGKLVNAEKCDN
jgi:hypothetical protein